MEREKEKSDKARSNAEKRYNKEDSAQVVLTGSSNGIAIRTALCLKKPFGPPGEGFSVTSHAKMATNE
jgi:hypothetical protein